MASCEEGDGIGEQFGSMSLFDRENTSLPRRAIPWSNNQSHNGSLFGGRSNAIPLSCPILTPRAGNAAFPGSLYDTRAAVAPQPGFPHQVLTSFYERHL